MTAIANAFAKISLGPAAQFANLALFPLISDEPTNEDPGYIVLDDALAKGEAKVTEVSEGGSVPELLLENLANQKLLGVDGEELVGAKQNRILNLSILVAPGSRTVIPVSCVEAGRWSWRSKHFASSGRNIYAAARAAKMSHVNDSMRRRRSRRSDQSALWDDIAMKSARMNVHSETGAMSDVFERHTVPIRDYVTAFAPQPRQVGAVFAIDGKVAGAELFDSPATFGRFLPRIVESYALDAIETAAAPSGAHAEPGAASELLEALQTGNWEAFLAIGIGEDLRMDTENLTGGALIDDGRLLHLAAFVRQKRQRGPEFAINFEID